MTITELIKDLEILKEKYGDKEILTYNQDFPEPFLNNLLLYDNN